MDYTALSEMLDRIDQTAYGALLVLDSEIRSSDGRLHEDDRVWKGRVMELVGSELRDRPLDWETAYYNIIELSSRADSLEGVLILASELGMLDEVSLLIEAGIDPSARGNAAIIEATKAGQANVVALLLGSPLVDPTVNDNSPYKIANRDGYYQVAEILLDDKRVRALVA